MARILFLHGLDARPGGIKPTYLSQHDHEVANPALPRDDFDASVRIAESALADFQPEIIVGSSRGGAVALTMNTAKLPVVLLAPAWRFFDLTPRFHGRIYILHSPADTLIPISHSEELLRLAPANTAKLLHVGEGHSLTDEYSLMALDQAIREMLSVP